MNRDPAGRAAIIAAIMVGAGALLSGLLNFFMLISNVPAIPRSYFLQDPIGWALTPRFRPMAVVAMFVALLLLVGLTWLFVRMVVRTALPGRAAAVFFGAWGAIIVAGWISGLVRMPLMMAVLRIPTDRIESFGPQLLQFSTVGATWALGWGWVTALVIAMVHRSSGARIVRPVAHPSAGYPTAGPWSPGM